MIEELKLLLIRAIVMLALTAIFYVFGSATGLNYNPQYEYIKGVVFGMIFVYLRKYNNS